MSHVSATPQALADAAGNLAAIGSTISRANATVAAGTAGVKAPGGDSVSAFITALFAVHAQTYQAAGAQAASYHDLFVQTLRAGAGSYANAETANASRLQKVGGMVRETSQISAGHLKGNGANGANGAMGTGPQGGVGGPLNGNGATGGPGADGRAAAIGGPQGGDAGGGAGGAASGGGGGAGEVADPGGAGGGPGSASGAGAGRAAGASVPIAWGPAGPVAPVGPLVPGLATAPGAPPVMAGGYPATAGLAGIGGGALSGDSPAIGGLGEPAAPAAPSAAASPVAAPPAAEPALATATKAQPVHPGNPARPDNAAHPGHPVQPGHAAHPAGTHHDKPALFLPLPGLRGLRRKLQQRSGLRDPIEWRKELREAAIKKPWGRDELLGVLGLRPPGSE
jgi:hypothetical protein